jgi:thiosulfate/3-mercaptopyruvate sulfurtransferase
VEEAVAHLHDPSWLFVDCRFVLGQPDRGREMYLEAHIPGAVYADLDRDLSGPIVPGRTGRHPLPSEPDLEAMLSRLGVDEATQVVAYDEAAGGMAAARLWWLLQWAGHDAAAVLDGGLARWRAVGLPVSSGLEKRAPARFTGHFRPTMVAEPEDVLAAIGGAGLVLDVRAAERYRGEHEPIDPVAGHIPGARSLPYHGNVGADGRFLAPDTIGQRLAPATHEAGPENTILYCGSGVTAAQSVLAYAHAGLGLPKLYAGSWSEWITDPERPVATGE